ncbi:hypothetical protein KVV02_006279 [Mortierella alpina]|uniref:Transmembrane protein n=1 Tax=Mortierella alpina TaxID=64518 RepID=A0A9P8A403_MORAP|nr:hypothetical protein KVV02_006279 [Mortierella alpina]
MQSRIKLHFKLRNVRKPASGSAHYTHSEPLFSSQAETTFNQLCTGGQFGHPLTERQFRQLELIPTSGAPDTMRPLTLLQRQRITLSLFFTVAVGAVFTVAAPAFVPWQVVDKKRAQALDQQRRQGKDFHVIANRRRSGSGEDTGEQAQELSNTSPSTATGSPTISSQGPIISLLTDHTKQRDFPAASITDSNPEAVSQDPSDPSAPTKKRRRRRRRKMVNEGWQELTGRTAREEKERQHVHTDPSIHDAPVPGENGGIEISWKNKAQP